MSQSQLLTTESRPEIRSVAAWRVVRRAAEIGLLIPAFGLLVPPVASEPGTRYALFPNLLFAAALYAASLMFAIHRTGENWLTAAFKLVLFCGLGWIIHARVTGL
jgi:hypothetical protein